MTAVGSLTLVKMEQRMQDKSEVELPFGMVFEKLRSCSPFP